MGMGIGRQRGTGVVDGFFKLSHYPGNLLLDVSQNWVDDLGSDFII